MQSLIYILPPPTITICVSYTADKISTPQNFSVLDIPDMIAPLILYSPGSFLFFEQYSSSVVVPVIIPLGALLFYSLVNDITIQTLSDFGSILKESQLSVSKKNMLCIYAMDCVTHVIFDVFAEVFPVTIIATSHSLDIFELLTLAKVKMYVLNGCNISFCGSEPV